MRPLTLSLLFLLPICSLHAEVAGTLLEPARIALMMGGKQVGSVTVPQGTRVKVIREQGGKTLIATAAGQQAWIPSSTIRQVGAAPIPAQATPAPANTALSTSAPAKAPSQPVIQAGPEKIQLPEEPTEDEVTEFLPPTAPTTRGKAPKKRVLILDTFLEGDGSLPHWYLARYLKEQGQEVTIVDVKPETFKPDDLRAPFANDKWLKRDEVNLAEFDVVVGMAYELDPLFFEAINLGKLVVNAQPQGPWIFLDDKQAAKSLENAYLSYQVERGFLRKADFNRFWKNSPTFDESADKLELEGLGDAIKQSVIRPGDVVALGNIVVYNVFPNTGMRGLRYLSGDGYYWDYGKGWGWNGGYNAKSAEKLVATVVLPAVLEAIRTHREKPKTLTPPKLQKAAFLAPRPKIPLAFPPKRPQTVGKVIAWGGQPYDAASLSPSIAAALNVPEGLQAVQVVCTFNNACLALKPDGTVAAWGDNQHGLNDVPAGLNNVVQIAAGDEIAAALKADGTVVTWGKAAKSNPDFSKVVQIAVVQNTVFGLKADGTVAGSSNVVQIVGGHYLLGLTAEGKILTPAWGDIYIPKNLGEVHSLAECHNSRADQIVALLVDGKLASWGRDDEGQTTVPEDLKDVVRVSISSHNTYAITRDWKLRAWGANLFKQMNFPKDMPRVAQVSASEAVCLAIVEK